MLALHAIFQAEQLLSPLRASYSCAFPRFAPGAIATARRAHARGAALRVRDAAAYAAARYVIPTAIHQPFCHADAATPSRPTFSR